MHAMSLLALLACGSDNEKNDSVSVVSDEDARATDLWDELSGYETWEQHSDWTRMVLSEDGTHGDYVSIRMNDAAAAVINSGGGGDLPEGSIIVKEGYNDVPGGGVGDELKGLTVMLKEEGWGDDGWFWAKFDTDRGGGIQRAGALAFCANCHAAGQDAVLFTTW